LFAFEKERMQWHLEKQILTNNKFELEEKFNQLFSKLNSQQKELEALKKPPVNVKLKESVTKNSIKDMMKDKLQSSQHQN